MRAVEMAVFKGRRILQLARAAALACTGEGGRLAGFASGGGNGSDGQAEGVELGIGGAIEAKLQQF